MKKKEKPIVKIDEWEVVYSEDQMFMAPETRTAHLRGKVYDHPDHEEGEILMTSPIVDQDGFKVETKNTIYYLVDPSEGYVAWCESHGRDWRDFVKEKNANL